MFLNVVIALVRKDLRDRPEDRSCSWRELESSTYAAGVTPAGANGEVSREVRNFRAGHWVTNLHIMIV